MVRILRCNVDIMEGWRCFKKGAGSRCQRSLGMSRAYEDRFDPRVIYSDTLAAITPPLYVRDIDIESRTRSYARRTFWHWAFIKDARSLFLPRIFRHK